MGHWPFAFRVCTGIGITFGAKMIEEKPFTVRCYGPGSKDIFVDCRDGDLKFSVDWDVWNQYDQLTREWKGVVHQLRGTHQKEM